MAGPLLLPPEVTVGRSTVIEARPSEVYPWMNARQKAAERSPWMSPGPDKSVTCDGTGAGVGKVMSRVSADPDAGSGRQAVVQSTLDTRVDPTLDFGGMGTAKARAEGS